MIPVGEYIAQYRDCDKFIGFCKECKNYGTLWACPPFENDPTPKISAYKYAYIIGTKVYVDEQTRHSVDTVEQRTKLTYDILLDIRKVIDARLIELEKEAAKALAFYAGSCRQCTDNICTRKQGAPCIKPELMRSSLESVGFDIALTTSQLLGIELKWSTDHILPEYFTLVSALFTNQELEIQM